MRFWLTSFFVLFALVKLVEWARSLQVPPSVFIGAGLLLAIASNYDKRHLFPLWPDILAARSATAATAATAVTAATAETTASGNTKLEPETPASTPVETTSDAAHPAPELPSL